MIKQCPVCTITIDRNTKQYKQKVFCSVKCRKSAHRKKVSASTRISQRRANLLQNKEALYLVEQCRRAGTVQILTGHTIESFTQTMSLVRERPKGDVKLCHIAPVKGKNSIGLFHCQNLFYGGTHQNRQFGKRYIANGISIPHSKLKDKWRVSNKEATNEILLKIEIFLDGIVQSYIETTPVRKSKKYQIAQKILELSDDEDLENLMRSSYQELKDKWETVSHRKIFKIEHRPESKFLAYLDELSRFITYGGTRKPMFRKIRDTLIIGYMALERAKDSSTYNKYFYVKYEPLIKLKYAYAKLSNDSTWSNFKDFCYETAFFALQGGEVNTREFRNEFMSYLEFSKPNEI